MAGRGRVENAYKIGPALVEIGFDPQELSCARAYFEPAGFSDALNWLESSGFERVAGVRHRGEHSRISELVTAVKKFAYGGDTPKELDVHDSLQSTLTILGHKLRIKQISVGETLQRFPSRSSRAVRRSARCGRT